jgi:hypothetical protein
MSSKVIKAFVYANGNYLEFLNYRFLCILNPAKKIFNLLVAGMGLLYIAPLFFIASRSETRGEDHSRIIQIILFILNIMLFFFWGMLVTPFALLPLISIVVSALFLVAATPLLFLINTVQFLYKKFISKEFTKINEQIEAILKETKAKIDEFMGDDKSEASRTRAEDLLKQEILSATPCDVMRMINLCIYAMQSRVHNKTNHFWAELKIESRGDQDEHIIDACVRTGIIIIDFRLLLNSLFGWDEVKHDRKIEIHLNRATSYEHLDYLIKICTLFSDLFEAPGYFILRRLSPSYCGKHVIALLNEKKQKMDEAIPVSVLPRELAQTVYDYTVPAAIPPTMPSPLHTPSYRTPLDSETDTLLEAVDSQP